MDSFAVRSFRRVESSNGSTSNEEIVTIANVSEIAVEYHRPSDYATGRGRSAPMPCDIVQSDRFYVRLRGSGEVYTILYLDKNKKKRFASLVMGDELEISCSCLSDVVCSHSCIDRDGGVYSFTFNIVGGRSGVPIVTRSYKDETTVVCQGRSTKCIK